MNKEKSMEQEKEFDDIQEINERICNLKNQEGILKKREKVFKIVARASLIAFLASVVLWVSAFVMNAKNQHDLVQNSDYDEFNTEYIETETEKLAEKLYHKEISADEFTKQYQKLQPISQKEYFEKFATDEQKAAYQKSAKKDDAIFAGFIASSVSTGVVGFSVGSFGGLNVSAKRLQTSREIDDAHAERIALLRKKNKEDEDAVFEFED